MIADEIKEPKKLLSDQALKIMQDYHWPGNVRQLENTCRWLSVMANSQTILEHDLPQDILSKETSQTTDQSWKNKLAQMLINDYQKGDDQIFIKTEDEIEQLLIKTALEVTLGKKAEASKLLGWGRNTLTRKLKD